MLRDLDEARIGPGSELRVAGVAGDGGTAADDDAETSVVVTVDGRPRALPRAAAEAIWISA
jgi:hypothetical protein